MVAGETGVERERARRAEDGAEAQKSFPARIRKRIHYHDTNKNTLTILTIFAKSSFLKNFFFFKIVLFEEKK